MPPFKIDGDRETVVWRLSIDEAKEVAEYLEQVEDRFGRAKEMAFDLRQGVQLAMGFRGRLSNIPR